MVSKDTISAITRTIEGGLSIKLPRNLEKYEGNVTETNELTKESRHDNDRAEVRN